MKYWIFILICSCAIACSKSSIPSDHKAARESEQVTPQSQRPESYKLGKIFEREGKKFLYGGEKEEEHFDISNCSLNDRQYHYGIGRERFSALIKPKFMSVPEADSIFAVEDRFLLLKIGQSARAYSIQDLTRHEVVNDEIDGHKVMAAYCILADLGAIYDRSYYEREFTFALSGYTYYDPKVWDGMDGFVMWDRETESLWWPLIGSAVSGPMKGTKMKVLDEQYWAQTTWGELSKKFPDADVLIPGQDFKRPESWPKYNDMKEQIKKGASHQKSISPRWGENSKIDQQ